MAGPVPRSGHSAPFEGSAFPPLCQPLSNWVSRHATLANLLVVTFLLTQVLDGIFTYIGVTTFGISIEANPIIASLMTALGHGPGLLSAKLLAAGLGIMLHLRQIHAAIAALSAFYLVVAIVPWSALLFS